MSSEFPVNKSAWRKAAEGQEIRVTQPLAAGIDFVSGSKSKFEHFLRLRILYKRRQSLPHLHKYFGSGRVHLDRMQDILDKDASAVFLKGFLQTKQDLQSYWNVENAKNSGIFAVAIELLHLIASRKPRSMEVSEDETDTKIVLSPVKARNTTLSSSAMATSTPLPRRQVDIDYFESPSSSIDMSNLSIAPKGKFFAQLNSELRQEQDRFERSNFSPGDEQTVNAALVALMMSLSWLLGFTGCVHHDRASFRIPTKDGETDLYKAAVDGLIMHLGKDKCNGFMEVKRDFRGDNQRVRRQIAAQMAAFIYEQDVVLAEDETETGPGKETGKATRSKGKAAEAQKGQKQHKVGGNQKQ